MVAGIRTEWPKTMQTRLRVARVGIHAARFAPLMEVRPRRLCAEPDPERDARELNKDESRTH